jgi:hypothetical protein
MNQGYALYLQSKSLADTVSIEEARGWLEAQWDEGAAEAELWGVRYRALHPRHLTDGDVVGEIRMAERFKEMNK